MSALNLENTKTTLLARLPQAKVAHVFRESKQNVPTFWQKRMLYARRFCPF